MQMKTLTLSDVQPKASFHRQIRVWDACHYFTRLRGLIGRKLGAWDNGQQVQGLVLTPCAQVHTFFMAYPLDLCYLNRSGRVLQVLRQVPPGRYLPGVRNCYMVLELPAGGADALRLNANTTVNIPSQVNAKL